MGRNYLKIDKHFIQGPHEDPVKLNFVKSIQSMATALNCNVIAEGIETVDEFTSIEKISITHAQGYYLGRPAATPVEKLDSSLLTTNHAEDYEPKLFNPRKASYLARYTQSSSSETAIREV